MIHKWGVQIPENRSKGGEGPNKDSGADPYVPPTKQQ